MIKYCFLFKLAVVLLLPICTSAADLEKVSLQLQWKHQFQFAGFYMAIEQGYYENEGLEVELLEIESKKNTIDEVLSHNATYGTAYSDLVLSYMQGEPVVILANIFKHSPLVLISQKEFKTLSSLSDKKIMGDKSAIYNSAISDMFIKQNISMKGIKQVKNRYTLDAFINKRIDAKTAFITNEPYLLDSMGIKYNIFSPTNYGTEFYDVNIFTSLDETQKHPDRTKAFLRASIKGWEYALNHSDETIELILDKYNTQGKTKEALEYEAQTTRNLILPYVYELGSIDHSVIEKMARQYVFDNKMPDKEIDFSKFYIDGKVENKQKDSSLNYIVLTLLFMLFLFMAYKQNKTTIK